MEDGICADEDTDLHQKDRVGRQMSRQICRCCREEKKIWGSMTYALYAMLTDSGIGKYCQK